MAIEEARSLADYRFFVLQGDARTISSAFTAVEFSGRRGDPRAWCRISRSMPPAPLLPVGVNPATFGVSAADARNAACTRAARPRASNACRRPHDGRGGDRSDRPQPNESDALPAQKKYMDTAPSRGTTAHIRSLERGRGRRWREGANARPPMQSSDLKLDSRLATRSDDEDRPQAPALAKAPTRALHVRNARSSPHTETRTSRCWQRRCAIRRRGHDARERTRPVRVAALSNSSTSCCFARSG